MKRHLITVGAKTTVGGDVRTGTGFFKIEGQPVACAGDEVYCPECDSTGVIALDGPHLNNSFYGRQVALDGDLCRCKCDPPPRLEANQTIFSEVFENAQAFDHSRAATQSFAPTPAAPRSFNASPAAAFSEQPTPFCENLWRSYQMRAEAIVAPGGILIADPKARNRAINAAYANLWLKDPRFQWAGLAAFASKQVGCGLLHAVESIEKIQAEHQAGQRMIDSAERRWKFPGLTLFGKTDKRAQRDYEQARSNNPVPGVDLRRDGEPLSLVQQQLQFVHDMLALGNTTLFLDVYPLHLFYSERGLGAFEECLEARENIYEIEEFPVLWPIGQMLKFGTDYKEIRQTFRAVEMGDIAKSVEHLAKHEQVNILQPSMYSDVKFVRLLRANHASFVTGIPSGAAQAIELTLASQCQRIDDSRTIGFGSNPLADLSDIDQRMAFVLKAAMQFHSLLEGTDRHRIEQSIRDIAAGYGVR
ncbi:MULTISPECIES: PAAR domain-containing protein [Pseudomonas]|uniref:PAAR domain-containing protein n=1 Tax=Pseudomonas TaxID=286 RepID=UPI00210B1595|nr:MULTISPECIES: PAAR domain-containing protein [Pseudomonas]WSO24314.1 PAAR domain-containing protein [Pseudomonas fluorescens]